jgi:hypothetical protein
MTEQQLDLSRFWALDATPEQARAVKATFLLEYLLCAIASETGSTTLWAKPLELYKYFSVFAKKVGLIGEVYELHNGICIAMEWRKCFDKSNSPVDENELIAIHLFSFNPAATIQKAVAIAEIIGINADEKTLLDAARAFLDFEK